MVKENIPCVVVVYTDQFDCRVTSASVMRNGNGLIRRACSCKSERTDSGSADSQFNLRRIVVA
jgi:hypothetical protein